VFIERPVLCICWNICWICSFAFVVLGDEKRLLRKSKEEGDVTQQIENKPVMIRGGGTEDAARVEEGAARRRKQESSKYRR
jgi:hypothetical protein